LSCIYFQIVRIAYYHLCLLTLSVVLWDCLSTYLSLVSLDRGIYFPVISNKLGYKRVYS
jgi:hypothetical protein